MRPRVRDRGFALLAAIFVLVIMSGAGALALRVSATQSRNASMALLGARTYYAAYSGIEWATYKAINGGGCPSASFALAEETASGIAVSITCSSADHVEGATTRSTLSVESTASYGSFGDRDFISRGLQVTIVL